MGLKHLQNLICTYSADDLRPFMIIHQMLEITEMVETDLLNVTY